MRDDEVLEGQLLEEREALRARLRRAGLD